MANHIAFEPLITEARMTEKTPFMIKPCRYFIACLALNLICTHLVFGQPQKTPGRNNSVNAQNELQAPSYRDYQLGDIQFLLAQANEDDFDADFFDELSEPATEENTPVVSPTPKPEVLPEPAEDEIVEETETLEQTEDIEIEENIEEFIFETPDEYATENAEEVIIDETQDQEAESPVIVDDQDTTPDVLDSTDEIIDLEIENDASPINVEPAVVDTQETSSDVSLEDEVEVIGDPSRIVTPLPGVNIDKGKISTNIQTATGEDIRESQAISTSQFMNERLQSVTVNDYSGNSFRQDVNFRGFSASPLIGTAQGLSIYIDGIRVNEAFGDVVNWDLIPLNAVDGLALMPGSNPLFGLNTIGGALSITTKSGFTSPGIESSILTGSWGRRQLQMSGGYSYNNFASFIAFNRLTEEGWRDNSPSSITQALAKLEYQGNLGQLGFTNMLADNKIIGNGTLPYEEFIVNPESVYTAPDINQNKLSQFQLNGRFDPADNIAVSFMAYKRTVEQDVNSGDFWDDWDAAAATRTNICSEQLILPSPPFPPRLFIDGAQGTGTGPGDPGCIPNGIFINTELEQNTTGSTLQFNWQNDDNQLVIGTTYDSNKSVFNQTERLGWIDENRNVVLDPDRQIENITFAGAPFPVSALTWHDLQALQTDIQRNRVFGSTSTAAAFFYDVWQFHEKANLSFGIRYSHTSVDNVVVSDLDIPLYQFNSSFLNSRAEICGAPDDVGARFQCSAESFRYHSLNPAIGISWQPTNNTNLFANVSKGNRTPTAIELACARTGEDDPQTGKFEGCTIPTAGKNDPYLPQVISISKEIGARGEKAGISWNAAFFRTDLRDDILFTSLGFGNLGVFDTFGKTRRQGFEFGVGKNQGKIRWFANYTNLEATYQSSDTIVNLSNSTSLKVAGQPNTFQIEPGDHIPGFPEHSFRTGIEMDISTDFTLGVNVIAQGKSFVQGNENNAHQPGGNDSDGSLRSREYVGEGTIPGFAIFNLNARYYLMDFLSVSVRVENLFNKSYVNAGNLALNSFTESVNGVRDASGFNHNSNDWTHSLFVAPGAPRAGWVGINLRF